MPSPQIAAEHFAGQTFDYLIIGGGTAGLVVAARLSENADLTIGVLEAGAAPTDVPYINVPGRFGEGIGTEIDWQFETVSQKKLKGRKLPWPRGKVLGGTSALNFMVWNRPNRGDLDAWRDLGNDGWGWDEVLPFYKKSEHFVEPNSSLAQQHKLFYDRDSLGTEGPLPVSYLKDFSLSHQYWHETLHQLDVPTNRAHFSGSNVGAWTSIATVHPETASRTYSSSAYYLPHATRPNLLVLTGATVQRIVLERSERGLVARGARFSHADGGFTALASREVILCAGSVASPQLLELSGIGSASVLEQAGIKVKLDNPNVGENLQDHIMTATIYELDPSIPSPDDLKTNEELAAEADKLYETNRSGPRALLACSLCYLPLKHFIPHQDLSAMASRINDVSPRNKIRASRLSNLSTSQNLGQMEYIFDIGNWSPLLSPQPGKKYGTLLQILQYPFSRGSIHIASNVATDKPVIDPQYYDGEDGALDLEVQLHAARFGQKILQTQPLKDFVRKRVWPPEDVKEDAWKEWLIDNTVTDWHPIGTCAMGGKDGIKAGVVDDQLRVYGVSGLRVVDASIMPLQVSAHLQATVYAIAEKGSHMIMESLRRSE